MINRPDITYRKLEERTKDDRCYIRDFILNLDLYFELTTVLLFTIIFGPYLHLFELAQRRPPFQMSQEYTTPKEEYI